MERTEREDLFNAGVIIDCFSRGMALVGLYSKECLSLVKQDMRKEMQCEDDYDVFALYSSIIKFIESQFTKVV